MKIRSNENIPHRNKCIITFIEGKNCELEDKAIEIIQNVIQREKRNKWKDSQWTEGLPVA